MKEVIEGKIYDTETAMFKGSICDMDYRVLYKTADEDYFFYCKGYDGEETIEPCSDDEGRVVEIIADSQLISYEVWKIEMNGLLKVKEFILNSLEHPFEEDLVVKWSYNSIVLADKNITRKIYVNTDVEKFSIEGDFAPEEYQRIYDIYRNRKKIADIFLTEISSYSCEDDEYYDKYYDEYDEDEDEDDNIENEGKDINENC